MKLNTNDLNRSDPGEVADKLTNLYFDTMLEMNAPPDPVWHFTNGVGPKGILESRKLWLSDVRTLDDKSEWLHTYDQAIAIVDEYLEGALPGSVVPLTPAAIQLLTFLRGNLGRLKRDSNFVRHVVCFCARSDLLSQWRAYGANGGGYAIGFDASRLRDSARNARAPTICTKVIYDPKSQNDKLLSLISGFLHALDYRSRNQVGMYPANQRALLNGLQMCLVVSSASFRSYAFHEEEKWRIVRLLRPPSGEMKFRTSGNNIVPHSELEIFEEADAVPLPITEVILGPTVDRDAAEAAIGELMYTYCGTRRFKTRPSILPYRA